MRVRHYTAVRSIPESSQSRFLGAAKPFSGTPLLDRLLQRPRPHESRCEAQTHLAVPRLDGQMLVHGTVKPCCSWSPRVPLPAAGLTLSNTEYLLRSFPILRLRLRFGDARIHLRIGTFEITLTANVTNSTVSGAVAATDRHSSFGGMRWVALARPAALAGKCSVQRLA
jgi:hypothetical protein